MLASLRCVGETENPLAFREGMYRSVEINQNKFVAGKFTWQEGYGAFSYSKSQIPNVVNYIENQDKHHAKKGFLEEYRKILDDLGVEYDQRDIFHEIE